MTEEMKLLAADVGAELHDQVELDGTEVFCSDGGVRVLDDTKYELVTLFQTDGVLVVASPGALPKRVSARLLMVVSEEMNRLADEEGEPLLNDADFSAEMIREES